MKRRNLFFVIALIIGVAFSLNASLVMAKDMTADDLKQEAYKNIETITVSDGKAIFDKGGAIFLDIRTDKEYKAGHIPGSIHISRGLLEWFISKEISDKNATIVVYCKTGGRSCLGTNTLVKMGYKNAKNMDGGWKAWEKAGYPVE